MEIEYTEAGTLKYKGRPLVRSNDTIYYGNMEDQYVALLKILAEEPFEDTKLPSRVLVQILATDDEIPLQKRVLKKTEKPTLYEAINFASIWLERKLSGKAK